VSAGLVFLVGVALTVVGVDEPIPLAVSIAALLIGVVGFVLQRRQVE
jgi:hypothetical protein